MYRGLYSYDLYVYWRISLLFGCGWDYYLLFGDLYTFDIVILLSVGQHRSYQIYIKMLIPALGAEEIYYYYYYCLGGILHLGGPSMWSLPWGQKKPSWSRSVCTRRKILDMTYIYMYDIYDYRSGHGSWHLLWRFGLYNISVSHA